MKKMVIPKGSYGYIASQRRVALIRTLLYFGVSIGLYIMGYVSTGSNRNLLTIVAVLGCLPACKSLVNLVILLRATGCSATLRNRVERFDRELATFYDMYFTSYQKNFAISHMTFHGNVLCGISEQAGTDCNGAENHLEQMLSQEGIRNVTVKIYSDSDKYIDRLSQIEKLNAPASKYQEEIANLLNAISI